MTGALYEFEGLSTRKSFNRNLRHFKAATRLMDEFEAGTNLAESINTMISAKEMEPQQVDAIVFAMLVDKYGYHVVTGNMESNFDDFKTVAAEVTKWDAVDLFVTYHHPELGLLCINPKNIDHWIGVQTMRKNEFFAVYAGGFKNKLADTLLETAISKLISYIQEGKIAKAPDALRKGKFKFRPIKAAVPTKTTAGKVAKPSAKSAKEAAGAGGRRTTRQIDLPAIATTVPSEEAPAQKIEVKVEASKAPIAAASSTGKVRMTPQYSVPVTNELFHNGNVEAWKKVIESFTTKYPGLEVYIFYDGERIHDINTLFKWGKVKHGSAIMFAVAGESIKDVAKLQRYLMQGASPRFEDFLRYPVNTILPLF